jgi:hypothetical protein
MPAAMRIGADVKDRHVVDVSAARLCIAPDTCSKHG